MSDIESSGNEFQGDARTSGTSAFPIVGVGASAGGLEALEKFFDSMPSDAGAAFVVVQHLSPDFKSLMNELLARHTKMAIHRVEDGVPIEINSIYLIPPKVNMRLSNGRLLLTDQAPEQGLRHPIDIFFESLALDAGANSIAVVLSGTGSDGSRGIRDVRQAGGLVVAQDLESAGFDGMPRSAIATGVVDVVAPPELMPGKIIEFIANPDMFVRGQRVTEQAASNGGDMFHLFRIFRENYGIDFSLYKPATINRRLERRMQLGKFETLSEYIAELENTPDELDLLYRDLLVEVTRFFRDTENFDQLRDNVIPNLISAAAAHDEIRVWVPGCATGQEAYSLAMLFDHVASQMERTPKVRIFASDVHQSSLAIAGNGRYSSDIESQLPEGFLEKYFLRDGDGYRVVAELRQMVVFATHDLTKDPPFTRISLITCRNVLIYFEPHVQSRVIATFHFALKKDGVLNLGPSETTGELAKEFEVLSSEWRHYQKLRDVRLPEMSRIALSVPMASIMKGRHHQAPAIAAASVTDEESWLLPAAYEDLLSKYIPPSILVNEFHDIVHTFGDARRMLIQPAGRPTVNLLKMVEGDLKTALGAGIHHANRKNSPISYSGIEIQTFDGTKLFTVSFEPYKKASRQLYLISFSEQDKPKAMPPTADSPVTLDSQTNERTRELERELDYTRESLQSTVEELETSNEELQSTNEELVASNEELQSTNEELHSVNEELHTVNSEYQNKIEELTVTNNDLNNFIVSTDVGTVFLDRQLRIRRFTPAVTEVMHLMEYDVGRPIHHIGTRFEYANFLNVLQQVLATGVRVDANVQGDEGRVFTMRAQAYRDGTDNIEGVVVSFDEVTTVEETRASLKQAELDLTEKHKELQDFAYAVSHDLQAPLRAILSYSSEILEAREEVALPDSITEWSDEIRTSTGLLQRMIQSLLSFSRIETRSGPFQQVDMDSLVQDVIDQLGPEIRNSHCEISVEELPPAVGDPALLTRVWWRLIDNAIKYSGEEPPRIHISAKVSSDAITYCIDDNGIGIEPRHTDRVFVMFQRLQTKPSVEGMGEGLAICRRILDHHHGQIWCDSKPGNGSSFYFRIPIADGQRDSQNDFEIQS